MSENVFGENLQFYRKQKNITQEQLAEQMDVSRQTISKWESGTSYPEMEKILQLCDFFSCDMDLLLRKNAKELEVMDNQGYDAYMEKYRKSVTVGVTLMVFGAAVYTLLSGLGWQEIILNTLFLAIEIVAVLVLVVAGMQDEIYRKNHPVIAEFYTPEEKAQFESKFPIRVAAGIGMILIGLVISMNGENFPRLEGMTEDFYYGIFLLLVTGAIGIFVYTGLGKAKYDIAGYNKKNEPVSKKHNEKVGIYCGCVMIIATILFFVGGFVFHLWEICWVVYLIGALICGMIALVMQWQ